MNSPSSLMTLVLSTHNLPRSDCDIFSLLVMMSSHAHGPKLLAGPGGIPLIGFCVEILPDPNSIFRSVPLLGSFCTIGNHGRRRRGDLQKLHIQITIRLSEGHLREIVFGGGAALLRLLLQQSE